MVGESTPAQFARKLVRVTEAVKTQEARAVRARAEVTKRFLLAGAQTRMPRKARPSWVSLRMRGDIAEVRLRGGFGHLVELGSYKKPEGWDETPKSVGARRIRNAARKGVTLTEKHAILTPDGPRASVHHPAVAARPFWKAGVAASREPGRKAYEHVVNTTISSALKH